MKTFIAVTEIHDRPDLKQPTRVTPTGKPIELDADDAKAMKAAGAIREATEDEVKLFNISQKEAAASGTKAKAAADREAAAKEAAAKKAADREAAAKEAAAKKAAAEAGGDTTKAADDMV